MMKIARLTVAGCETYWRVTLPLLLVPPRGFQCFAHPCSQPSRRPVWPPVAPIARLSRPTPARLPPPRVGPPPPRPPPSPRTENSPPGPGAMVFRGGGQFFATWRGDGFLVEIGASARNVAQFCTSPDFESGELLDHFVERPNGGGSSWFKSGGKVPMLLFP